MQNKYNPSIKCSVKECSYHHGKEDFCSLNAINVGKCKSSVDTSDATLCASFDKNGVQ